MRLYAPLLLALFAGAHAASIYDKIQPELEKKIVIDDEKPPAENVPSESVLVDPANTVIDVENNLRDNLKPVDIPVKVIVEEAQPVVKSAVTEPTYEVVEEEIKRPVVDLRNPGPPQHQEHETQNPEHYEDIERTVSFVKEEIQDSKVALRQSFQGVTNGIQNWYANNEQIKDLQSSINSLQENFSAQLQKLNDTFQNLLKPDSKPLHLEGENVSKTNIENIEAGLETLESNFKTGVQSLSEGIQTVANLREEGANAADSSGSSTTAAPAGASNPFQFLVQMMGDLQNSVSTGFTNIGQAFNNFVAQNQPNLPNLSNIFQQSTGTPLADTPVSATSTTPRPPAWQPFPIITGLINLIQRPGATTVKPADAPQLSPVPPVAPPSNPALEGTNAVPAPIKPEEIVTNSEPVKNSESSVNPIRKILESSPIAQGINVAVQRIQSANNPNNPRDTAEQAQAVKSEEIKPEGVKVVEIKAEEAPLVDVFTSYPEEEKVEEVKPQLENDKTEKGETEQEKGGLFYGPIHGHGHPGGIVSNSGQLETASEESQKVSEIMEEVKETEQVSDKTE